jgi:hypothetical protein
MARLKKIEAAALNIKIHPHSTSRYIQLFAEVLKFGEHVKIRDRYYGTIGWLRPLDKKDQEQGIEGEIYKYLNIDPTQRWFNKRNRKAVKFDGKTDIPPVPEELKPHLQEIYFIFYPKNHRLIFEANKFSPTSALRLFEGLINSSKMKKVFGSADVHIESSNEAIEKILKLSRLAFLEIKIAIPNPDDNTSDEKRVLGRMEKENAKTMLERKTSFKGGSLTPDKDTKILMRVARSNGSVYAEGYNEQDQRVKESTAPHPLIGKEYYDSNVSTIYDTFKILAKKMLSQILKPNG